MADADSKTCLRCKQTFPIDRFHRAKDRKDGRYPYCKPCHVAEVRARAASPEQKTKKREYDRQRVGRLKERLRAQNRANYLATREQRIANAAAWTANNRDRRRLISQTYKHRRRSAEREGMTWKELRDWKSAQSKVCRWCGVECPSGYVVDHVQPLAKGGKHEACNLVIACRPCNARKAARDPEEFARMVGRSTSSPDMLQ